MEVRSEKIIKCVLQTQLDDSIIFLCQICAHNGRDLSFNMGLLKGRDFEGQTFFIISYASESELEQDSDELVLVKVSRMNIVQ